MHADLSVLPRDVPKVYRYSLDWRFFLPETNVQRVHVFFADDDEFSQALDKVGIPRANQHTFAALTSNAEIEVPSMVFPFGIPRAEDPIGFLHTCRRWIEPGGCLMIGFNNTLYRRGPSSYQAARPRRLLAQLGKAGFQNIRMWGVMSRLSIPEYIFDLNLESIQFAFAHRFRRKRLVQQTLLALAQAVGPARISDYLPCYLAVAVA
jgi:hypothetical protein